MKLRYLIMLLIVIGAALFVVIRTNPGSEQNQALETLKQGPGKSYDGAVRDRGEEGQGRFRALSSRVPQSRPEKTTTASGLQYEVLREGEGSSPGPEDTVEVHYHGTLEDGTVFDSSIERGASAVFPLNQVIRGWTEGLQLMKPGAKYRFTIPSDLAYGDRGVGEQIPPGTTLVFEVELIAIKDPES